MSKSSLMSSTALLSEEDRALLDETSAPDLPSEMKNLIVHVQANSPELVAGDPKEYVGPSGERAFAGDWLLPRDGGRILVKGAVGYEFLVVAGDRVFVEYKQARGGWVADHLEKPNDAIWFEKDESPDGKAGLYRVGVDGQPGNRVEETIYAHELILPKDGGAPFTATQAFRSTAITVGRELMNRVSRKSPGGEVANPVLLQMADVIAAGAPRRLSLAQAAGDLAWQVRRAQWLSQGHGQRRLVASKSGVGPSRRRTSGG